jgi:hypothetical protein
LSPLKSRCFRLADSSGYIDLRIGREPTANQTLVIRLAGLEHLDLIMAGRTMRQDASLHQEHCPDGSHNSFKSL